MILQKNGAVMQCSAGWDWVKAAPDRNTGIWDQVTIQRSGDLQLDNAIVATRTLTFRDDGHPTPVVAELAELDVEVRANNAAGSAVSGILTMIVDGVGTVASPHFDVPAGAIDFALSFTVKLPGVRLWWPHTEGIPYLYNTTFTFEDSEGHPDARHTLITRFGIRTIHTRINSMTQSLEFHINGKRIFLLGGNWITTDQLLRFATDRQRYAAEVWLHKDMGLNMLKVWGGAVAERPEFYDECDAAGIVVWQEFWMTGDNNGRWAGNFSWPLDHRSYLKNVRDTVLLLRGHSSLMMWVGGNELYPEATNPDPDIAKGLSSLLSELDPLRIYVPSSMSNHTNFTTKFAMAPKDGIYLIMDLKQYFERNPGLYFWNNSIFQRADRLRLGFQPEIGSVSTPTASSMRRFLPPDALTLQALPLPNITSEGNTSIHPLWRFHNYLPYAGGDSGYDHIYGFGELANCTDVLDEYVWRAQLVQFSQYRALFEGFSAHMWDYYTGMLMWKSQSPWPSMRGALYDWYLDQTGGFFGVQTATERIHVQLDQLDFSVAIVNRADSVLPAGLELEVKFYDMVRGITRGAPLVAKIGDEIRGNTVAQRITHARWPGSTEDAEVLMCELILRRPLDAFSSIGPTVISRSRYWFSDPASNQSMIFLGRLRREGPHPALKAIAMMLPATGANSTAQLDLRHPGEVEGIAFFVRVQLLHASAMLEGEDQRLLPVHYSRNYVSLLPGESIRIIMSTVQNVRSGLAISIEGWNVKRVIVKVDEGPSITV